MGFSIAVKEIIKEKITLTAGELLLVEGHRGISEYTPQEVVVRIANGKLHILGEELTIAEINGEEIHITGVITAIERRMNNAKR